MAFDLQTPSRSCICRNCLAPLVATLVGGFVVGLGIANAQTNFQRILSFGPVAQLGSSPRAELMEGSDGMLYGTTYAGGSNNIGTVFRIAKDGSGFGVLHSLSEGSYPYAGLPEGGDGALYGSTADGGSLNGGIAFKLNKDGSGFLVLHDFDPAGGDGVAPIGTLCRGADGMLYGTTSGGGNGNMGTVFKLSLDGTVFSVAHTFTGLTNGVDGSYPGAGLTQARDGMLYGTTQTGGSNDYGAVFKLNPGGGGYSIIHSFAGDLSDGHIPSGTLLEAADGLLYGTTEYGGTNDRGTVFTLDTNGNHYAVLKSFAGGPDGKQPLAGLAQGSDGALYGTTRYGGVTDSGLAFEIATDGSGYAVLHSFVVTNGDGGQPIAGLLLGSDGAWYGACYYGGDYVANGASGILFRLLSVAQVRITGLDYRASGALVHFAGGAAWAAYLVQGSTVPWAGTWQTIGTNVAGIDGRFEFEDGEATNYESRFYRSALKDF